MAATTTAAIYRAILAKLRADLSIADDYIFLSALPKFCGLDSLYVQIVPGAPEAMSPRGGVGVIHEEFRVVIWSRLDLDLGGQSTARITDSTYGVLKFIAEVRASLVQHALTGATVPILLLRGSAAQESDEQPGWVYYEDTYRVGYEIAWTD